MKKRVISSIVVISVVLSALVGCGKDDYAEINEKPSIENENIADDSASSIEEEADSTLEETVEEAEEDDFPYADAEILTDEIFDYYATEGWQGAYKKVLAGFVNPLTEEVGMEPMNEYAVYDIDKNGIPELLIKSGTCEADYKTFFYSYDGNEAKSAGEEWSGHTSYYTYPAGNGIVQYNAHMGYAGAYRYSLGNDGIVYENEELFVDNLDERAGGYGIEYILVSAAVDDAKLIGLYATDCMLGLLEYDSALKTCSREALSHDDMKSMVTDILDCSTDFYGAKESEAWSSDTIFYLGKMNMADMYKVGGLFRYSDSEAYLLDSYYADFNEDGQEECLTVFSENQNNNLAFIIFSYQNERMYGYIFDSIYDDGVDVVGNKIYTSGEYGRYEYTMKFYLDQCRMEMDYSDYVAFSSKAEASLEEIRKNIKSQNGILGVALLGYEGNYSGKYHDEVIEEYADAHPNEAFYKELERCNFVVEPGEEVYLLVPVSNDCMINVYEQVWGEFSSNEMPERGRALYKGKVGEPILVRGNQSDIVSNLEISVIVSGKETIYHPQLSLENGEVMTGDGIVLID